MDNPNALLPSHDTSQAPPARSHRVTAASNRPAWSLRIFVSMSSELMETDPDTEDADLSQKHNPPRKTRQTPVPCNQHPTQCIPCRRRILHRWFHARSHLVGLRHCLVCRRCHHDGPLWRLSIQYGLVGLHLSSRSVLRPTFCLSLRKSPTNLVLC